MGLAQYAIVPVQDEWGVLHDGNINGKYATKESAFESAIAAASLAFGRAMRFMSACRVDSQMRPRLEAKARNLLGRRRI
jgi:hypothetical protein